MYFALSLLITLAPIPATSLSALSPLPFPIQKGNRRSFEPAIWPWDLDRMDLTGPPAIQVMLRELSHSLGNTRAFQRYLAVQLEICLDKQDSGKCITLRKLCGRLAAKRSGTEIVSAGIW